MATYTDTPATVVVDDVTYRVVDHYADHNGNTLYDLAPYAGGRVLTGIRASAVEAGA